MFGNDDGSGAGADENDGDDDDVVVVVVVVEGEEEEEEEAVRAEQEQQRKDEKTNKNLVCPFTHFHDLAESICFSMHVCSLFCHVDIHKQLWIIARPSREVR